MAMLLPMFFKLVFLFLPVLLAACSSEHAELSRLPQDAVILAFGDSLTSGYGAAPDQSYPAILQGLSERKVINAGVTGEVSADGLPRLLALLKQHRPALLILCHGGNDILHKQSMSQMQSNLVEMIELAKTENIPVILLGVPRPGLFLSSHEAYETIADETGVQFIKDVIPEVLADNDLKSDTVHPNAKGYRVIAETVYAFLIKQDAL